MKVESLTPVVTANPGQQVACRVRIHNDGADAASYRLRLVGLDEPEPVLSVDGGAIAAGDVVDVDVPFVVPPAFASGQHPLAFEVTSDRPGERAALAPVAVDVGSLDRVVLEVRPPTIRGRRTGRFEVEVTNHEPVAMHLAIDGHGPDVKVRMRQPIVAVPPGQHAVVEGRVRGPRHLLGETRQHLVTITAHGHGAPISTTAPYRQPSLVPRPVRAAVVLLTVLAIWAAAVGAVAVWWSNRDDAGDASRAQLVDTDGDGVGDTPADEVPVGELDPDAAGGAGGAAGGDGGGGSEGATDASDVPTTTQIGGTIKAGDTGEDAGVTVRIAPTDLGATSATPAGLRRVPDDAPPADEGPAGKIWPIRAAPLDAGGADAVTGGVPMPRQTLSEEPVLSSDGGAWVIPDVPLGRSYELNFAKAGFDSQSFVVTPPSDGEPVTLDVELVPADGAIGGVVTGPSGPLGGVQIEVTDGTVVATTTTSTEPGSVGRWAIERLGTPATWTVTATLRGYGTEVAQVRLPAGGRQDALTISMTPGVGSIGGRVRLDGQPVGGVRLTVVDGDLERTTTSLTEGDTGTYRFPALPIPGEYTVSLAVDGFITETRRVALTGNASDVDFDLRRTTSSLTGLVRSDQLGPLVNASVVLTRDELEFRTVTAATPTAGAFEVDELPPGTYLVTIGRFDHDSVSTSVTLTAGQSLDLGTIVLTYDPTPELAATGSVVVRLFDTSDQPLPGGTVRVVDPSDGTELRSLTAGPDQNAFSFTNLPVGTYDIRASHPIHRTATRRVSIGLGEAPAVEFNLVKLGQASGRIVDSLDGSVRGGYEVTVHRLLASGARDPSFSPLRILPDTIDGPNGIELRWQTPVNSLTTGTYEVEVTQPPAGYAVVPDQVLDATLPVTEKMRFRLPADLETPFPVGDIEADPYPQLSGRLFRPVLNGSAVTLETLESDQIDATLACDGRAPVAGTPTSEVGPTTEDDAFVFDRFLTQSANLLGACRLVVAVDGLEPAVVDLAAPMRVSDGNVSADQRVNVALARTPADPAGTLYWLDEGTAGTQQVLLDGAAVAADDVVTGFPPAQNQGADVTPVADTVDVATSTVGGAWAGARQAFGTARYTFSAANLAPGAIDVTVDGTGTDPDVVAANGDTAVTSTGSGYAVELLSPADGTISGTVSIQTTATPRYGDVTIGADGGAAGTRTAAPGAAGAFTIPGVAAGTWTVDVDDLAGHVVRPPVPPATYPVTQRVEPGQTRSGFDVTLIELADITVQVRDGTQPIDVGGVVPQVAIRHVNVPFLPGDPASSSQPAADVDANGDRTFAGLAVNTVNPTAPASSTRYLVTVTMPGYDTSAATVQFGSAPPVPLAATDIPVDVLAGSDVTITVDLPRWGSVTGEVRGRPGDASVPSTQWVDLPFTELDLAEAVPVDASGIPTGGPAIPLEPVTATPGEHRVILRAPPGQYRIDIGHPNYEDGLVPEGAPAIWTIANRSDQTATLPFLLEISPGTVTGTVRASAPSGTLLAGATVTLSQGGTTVGTPVVTDGTGAFAFSDLVPGTYRIEVTATGRFSMIADFAVPTGASPGVRARTLVVPLPAVDAEIELTVEGRNGDGRPVPLPAYTVTRDFDEPAIVAEGTTELPNTLTADAPYDRSAAAGQTSDTFTMATLPQGVHDLTFSPATGFAAPAPLPVVLAATGTTSAGPVTYVAADRAVTVTVTTTYPSAASPLTGATVTLVPPLGDDTVASCTDPALPAPSASGGTYSFASVPPRAVPYTLCVTAPLHRSGIAGQEADAQAVAAVTVAPGTGTVTQSVPMVPNAAQVSGTIRKQDAGGSTPVPIDGATVELLKNSTVVGTPVTTAPDGSFSFQVDEVGLYTVRASATGYATRSIAVGSTELALGEARTANVTVPRLGTVAVTVNGASVDTFTVTITNPPITPAIVPSHVAGTRVYTFTGLDPDVDHTFQATTTEGGWYASTAVGNPNVGGTPVVATTITMSRRTISLTVTGPDSTTNVRAGARFPAGSGGTEVSALTQTADDFTFTSTANAIPLTGAGDLKVTATGFRTQVVAVPDASATSPTNALGSITLRPLVTVSGTVTTPAGVNASGLTITARNGSTVLTDTLDVADPVGAPRVGTYSIPGLFSGGEGETLTWTISSDIVGHGVASGTVDVSPVSPLATAAVNLSTYTPQPLALTFTVTSGGSPLDATVTIGGTPVATGSDGVVAISSVNESPTPIPYTVTAAGKLTFSGTVDVVAAGSRTIPVAVSLANRVTTVSGTVTGAGASSSTEVRVCNATGTCSGGTNLGEATVTGTSAPFSFSVTGLSLDTGSYRVQTGSGAGTVSVAITVSQTGAIAPSPITLNVP